MSKIAEQQYKIINSMKVIELLRFLVVMEAARSNAASSTADYVTKILEQLHN